MNTLEHDDAEISAHAEPTLTKEGFAALHNLYETCTPFAPGGFDRLTDAERVRYNLWGQESADGRLWRKDTPNGEEFPGPWDGCSGFRSNLADELTGMLVARDCKGWDVCFDVEAGNAQHTEQAGNFRRFGQYLINAKLLTELHRERTLSSQYRWTYGATLVRVGWERRIGFRSETVDMEMLKVWAQTAPEEFGGIETAVLDPTLEDDAVVMLQRIYEIYWQVNKPRYMEADVAPLPDKRARSAVRKLRKTGNACLPVPALERNVPMAWALKLWEDVFIPAGTTDIQCARAIFEKEWLSIAELENVALSEGWDEDFVAEAKKHKGEFTRWQRSATTNQPEFCRDTLDDEERIEIIHAYEKKVEDGILGVYHTVFHAAITGDKRGEPLVGKSGLVEDPLGALYPFVELRAEFNERRLTAARGVPQILAAIQGDVASHVRMLTNHADITTLPPLNEPALGAGALGGFANPSGYNYSPFAKNPVARASDAPTFMAPPPRDGKVALELVQYHHSRADRYYGYRHADDPPDLGVKPQTAISSFLTGWSEVFQMMMQLTQHYLEQDDWQAIVGEGAPLPKDARTIEGEFQFVMRFNAELLDPEVRQRLIDQMIQAAALDRYGVTDGIEFMRILYELVDPNLARRLVKTQAQATEAMREKVRNQLVSLRQGNPPQLVENDPTAPMQLQFAQEFVRANPLYQRALMRPESDEDQVFRQGFETWTKNLQQAAMQTGENKMAGRTGVAVQAPQVSMPLPGG